MQELYVYFSDGAILADIADRTGGQDSLAGNDPSVEHLPTLASQPSGSCDTERSRQTVYLIKLFKL